MELLWLKAKQGITGNEFYHYNTPLAVEYIIKALVADGVSSAEMWGNLGRYSRRQLSENTDKP